MQRVASDSQFLENYRFAYVETLIGKRFLADFQSLFSFFVKDLLAVTYIKLGEEQPEMSLQDFRLHGSKVFLPMSIYLITRKFLSLI